MPTENIQIAVYGVSLSESESESLRDEIARRQAEGGSGIGAGLDSMLALGIDEESDDVDGPHFNSGYPHAVGVVMGESGYADAAKLALKPPSKFQKKFDSDHKALLASIGVTRRPRGILVEQARKA